MGVFLCFSMNSAVSERVSKAVKMVVGTCGDSKSSSHLEWSETSGSVEFWMNIG